ncbi:uncharacterized protein LOC112269988 [Brachypodium distachyon]|uniref:Uncharacterized protein n=1 Tax=Brachypodium distachyon TaxID=15368 RepID=I1H0S8_BRADI|nr:uncharacterized protein LOC112269988 [Brachypodium distachyon]PNT76473.1 hypothetical protein BRADI_1g48570v3 [Brachypodium distachyon]|eukprot:XP_024313348.1 uncharacterized protein LOC112269988 [Brachypodium distachyon]
MDRDAQHVWLRSRQVDAYLHATPDGTGVCLRRTRESMNAAWVLHGIPGEPVHVLLQSAAYGRYLAGTDWAAPWCQGGFRTVLTKYYDRAAQLHNILRECVLRGGYLQLRNVGGTRCLSANGRYFRFNAGGTRYLPWNTGVTVQDRGTTMHWDWDVEAIPLTPHFPGIPDPINEPVPGNLAIMFGRQRPRPRRRLIQFVQAADDGSHNQQVNDWTMFQFTGNSIFRLRNEVADILHTNDTHIIMFVRAGRHGRLTPMLVDLPRDGDGDTVEIVVFTFGTPGAAALRYPDINPQ